MNKNEFLNYVKEKCDTKGINLIISSGNTVKTATLEDECSGFFEDNPTIKPTLGIAEGLEEAQFFEVLAHEFCHSQQWAENASVWKNCRLTNAEKEDFSKRLNRDASSYETGDIVSLWIEKELELEDEELSSLIKRTTDVEFDCERRVLELCKELNLSIPVKTYAQKSNAYLLTYFFAQKERQWTKPGFSTYTRPEVYSKLPEIIDPSFCKNIQPEMIALIKNHCC